MAGQRGWERRVLMCAQSPSSHNGTTCAVHLPKHHQPKQKQNQTNCNIGSKGFDHVLCPDYKGDNAGPWSVEEVLEHWAKLHFEVCVCVRERVVFKYVVVLCCVVLCCVVCVCVCVCARVLCGVSGSFELKRACVSSLPHPRAACCSHPAISAPACELAACCCLCCSFQAPRSSRPPLTRILPS